MKSSVGVEVKLIAGCSKRPDFSPAQPRRLFHPPALSLPRQTLCPGTRLFPNKAATSDQNMILPSLLVISLGMGADRSSTARVQRGPSQAARCASKEDHQPPSLTLSFLPLEPAQVGRWDLRPVPLSRILPRRRNSRRPVFGLEFQQTIVWLPSFVPRAPDCPGQG